MVFVFVFIIGENGTVTLLYSILTGTVFIDVCSISNKFIPKSKSNG